jgi:hypothetical protein
MEIIAQRYSSPATLSPNRQKDFLFCPDGCELSRRLEKARANLVLNDSPRRNASFARTLAEVLRKRHRHLSCCSVCILREVFDGESPVRR